MLLGLSLFLICDFYPANPLVELPEENTRWIFTLTIVIIMLEIYFVMMIFSQAITRRETELKLMADIDLLTGLNNSRTFLSIGEETLVYAKRHLSSFSLIIEDIHYFKEINNNHGHLVGDKPLQLVAKELKGSIRESDVIAR